MRVQRVLMPGSGAESWTLLGDDQVPFESAERFLGYLASIEKSPNTVKGYAHDLKDWFTYLAGHDLDWQVVTVEDVAGFVAWLRLPPEAREGKVAVLPCVGNHCSSASVNRKLAALTSFCEFHARHGVRLAGLLTTMQPAGRRGSATSYKPFLHHISKSGPQPQRTIKLKTSRLRPKVLTAVEVQGSARSSAVIGPRSSGGCATVTSSGGGKEAARAWRASSPIPGHRSGAATPCRPAGWTAAVTAAVAAGCAPGTATGGTGLAGPTSLPGKPRSWRRRALGRRSAACRFARCGRRIRRRSSATATTTAGSGMAGPTPAGSSSIASSPARPISICVTWHRS